MRVIVRKDAPRQTIAGVNELCRHKIAVKVEQRSEAIATAVFVDLSL
jgi:hypothetical protein